MKYVMIAMIMTLGACTETNDVDVNGFDTTCMQGVLYYVDLSGYGSSLAPVINAETLTHVRCEGDTK